MIQAIDLHFKKGIQNLDINLQVGYPDMWTPQKVRNVLNKFRLFLFLNAIIVALLRDTLKIKEKMQLL